MAVEATTDIKVVNVYERLADLVNRYREASEKAHAARCVESSDLSTLESLEQKKRNALFNIHNFGRAEDGLRHTTEPHPSSIEDATKYYYGVLKRLRAQRAKAVESSANAKRLTDEAEALSHKLEEFEV